MSNDEPFDLEHEPFDAPGFVGVDWGGDGTDLSRPLRAHVLAALRPHTAPYTAPVDALLTLGNPHTHSVEGALQVIDLQQHDLPELLRMARDRELYTADDTHDTGEVWAPLHALTAMERLDISASLPELMPLYDLDDESYPQVLAHLLGGVGEPALAPLRAHLAERTRWGFSHWHACDALVAIAAQHPELYEQVVAILSDLLRDAKHYHEFACTGAMNALVEMGAVEALPLIRRAFELGKIDEMSRGPWGDVLGELGVDPEEGDPLLDKSQRRFEERRERLLPSAEREEIQAALARFSEQNRLAAPGSQAFNRLGQRPAQSQTYTRAQPKVGRNEPCPCGSGRKYKHCHGK